MKEHPALSFVFKPQHRWPDLKGLIKIFTANQMWVRLHYSLLTNLSKYCLKVSAIRKGSNCDMCMCEECTRQINIIYT